jgi:hypothetical protein
MKYYETDLARSLQEKFDAVTTSLCDNAKDREFSYPYEIEFFDGRGSVAEVTVEEDRCEWIWMPVVQHEQNRIEPPFHAVLKSRNNTLRSEKFSL